MNKVQWWKNFDLNSEVHIAGTFIYDGLQSLRHCRRLDHDDEIFSVLYHLSVGFERLMKVAIVLAEHKDETDQAAFEKQLITHKTDALLARIQSARPLTTTTAERALMTCLTKFYGTFRYDHFRLETIPERGELREAFRTFLELDSGITLGEPDALIPTDDIEAVQNHTEKIVRVLASKLYDLVATLARENNIFTYELRSDSKPAMIFLGGSHTFYSEEMALKELLLFFLKHSAQTKLKIVTENLEALDFDPPEAVECADAFFNPDQRSMLVDMVKALRDERSNLADRDELLALLGSKAGNLYKDEELRDEEDSAG
jgi:hypothetical protein